MSNLEERIRKIEVKPFIGRVAVVKTKDGVDVCFGNGLGAFLDRCEDKGIRFLDGWTDLKTFIEAAKTPNCPLEEGTGIVLDVRSDPEVIVPFRDEKAGGWILKRGKYADTLETVK